MTQILFWVYFANLILLIIHEIESAYWKEWELFKLKVGITGFLIIHIPLFAIALFGLIEIKNSTLGGYIISALMAFSGIFAFIIHRYFIAKGNKEFTLLISQLVLIGILLLSISQIILITFCL